MSCGLQPVLQAAVSNGLSLDPFSFGQDGWTAPEVDVGWGEIVDALVVAAVVVVADEGRDLGFEIAGQEVVFQQDAVFECLVPALDLALGHRMIRRAAQMLDLAVVEPPGQVARDVAGTVVGQEPGSIGRLGVVQPTGPQRQVERGGDILRLTLSNINDLEGGKVAYPRNDPRVRRAMILLAARQPKARAQAFGLVEPP